MEKDQIKLLKVILSSTKFLVNKFQVFHHCVGGDKFLFLHPFYGELYNDFFDFEDRVAERIEGLDGSVEYSLEKDKSLSVIKELTGKVLQEEAIKIAINDLNSYCVVLYKAIEVMGEDIVSQNIVADIAEYTDKAIWKLTKQQGKY